MARTKLLCQEIFGDNFEYKSEAHQIVFENFVLYRCTEFANQPVIAKEICKVLWIDRSVTTWTEMRANPKIGLGPSACRDQWLSVVGQARRFDNLLLPLLQEKIYEAVPPKI